MRQVRHAARMGRIQVHTGFWWGKTDRKRSLGRPRRRWKDNIKLDLQKLECGVLDWIVLSQDRDRWRALVNLHTSSKHPKIMYFCGSDDNAVSSTEW